MHGPFYNHPGSGQIQYSPEIRYNPFPLPRQSPYPPVDTTQLSQSVEEFQILIQQGEILLDRLGDTAFSHRLMEAAQVGNQSEVNRLIDSIEGLYVPVQTTYTPSGVIFDLQSPSINQGANCCTLNITLKWGR